jgi:peptide-methionine (S)-S-oxide reductase
MRSHRGILLAAVVIGLAFFWLRGGFVGIGASEGPRPPASEIVGDTSQRPDGNFVATFASGCFWSTESDFDKLPGVLATTAGYTGGRMTNPSYKQVSSGGTGHVESVEIVYDPHKTSYETLLDYYWHNVDPFNDKGQFCDYGGQYRPVIWVHGDAQRQLAEASRDRVEKALGDSVVVAIQDAATFYPAEEFHQDYHSKNSTQYLFYRYGCGRDRRIAQIWGGPKSD